MIHNYAHGITSSFAIDTILAHLIPPRCNEMDQASILVAGHTVPNEYHPTALETGPCLSRGQSAKAAGIGLVQVVACPAADGGDQ